MKVFFILMILLPLSLSAQQTNNAGKKMDLDQRIVSPSQQRLNNANTDFEVGEDDKIRNDDAFSEGFNNAGNRMNADQSQESSGGVNALGLAMGAAFTAVCITPTGKWACAPAALSFLDAAKAGSNGGNSSGFSDALQTGGADPADSGGAAFRAAVQEAEAQLKALEGQGVLLNRQTGTVQTPDGMTLSGSDFSSVQALEARGFTTEQAESILDKIAQVQSEAAAQVGQSLDQSASSSAGGVANGEAGSGSDGETSSGETIIEEVADDEGKVDGDSRLAGERFPSGDAAKLSRNFNGSPIGIGLADIFVIVNKKYEHEDKKNAFFKREY